MIFFRLRNNPQIPTKKRVKDTPKILNKLIGIFNWFYASYHSVGVPHTGPPTQTYVVSSERGQLPRAFQVGFSFGSKASIGAPYGALRGKS